MSLIIKQPNSGKLVLKKDYFPTPSLDLRFAETKSLTDYITDKNLVDHNRASPGTYVGSDGLIKTATTNYLLRSEEFDSAVWTAIRATPNDNTVVAPNGTLTASTFTATDADPYILQTVSFPAGTYTFSVYIKAKPGNSTNILRLRVTDAALGVLSSDLLSLTTEWERQKYTVECPNGITQVRIDAPDQLGASGDVVYLWGAQLEQSSTVGEYIPTTSTINSAPRFDHKVLSSTTNLALYSETFDEPEYTFQGLTKSFSTIDTPFGTKSVMLATETGGASVHHRFFDAVSVSGSFIASIFVKVYSGTKTVYFSSDTSAGRRTIVYDVTSASPSVVSSGFDDGDIEDYGNGWFRLWVKSSGDPDGLALNMWGLENGAVYAGDGSSGFYFFGSQLEQSDSLTAYVKTEADPVTKAYTESLGLLVEEDRTNLITDSSLTTIGSLAGVTKSSTTETNPEGIDFCQRLLCSNSNSLHRINVAAFSSNNITVSAFVKKDTHRYVYIGFGGLSHSFTALFDIDPTVTGDRLLVQGGIGTYTNIDAGYQNFPNGWVRIWAVGTATGIDGTSIGFSPDDSTFNMTTWDAAGTEAIFIHGVQYEDNVSFPTSYIPSNGSQGDRAADLASISGSNFSSWYSQSEGTVFASCNVLGDNGANQFIYSISDGALGDEIRLFKTSGNDSISSVLEDSVDGITSNIFGNTNTPFGTPFKTAHAFATNDAVRAINGINSSVDDTVTVPAVNQVKIGARLNDTFEANIHLSRLTYWNQRLPNSTLVNLTNGTQPF